MDCGPASLKCLLEAFGIPVSYGRLREACQTELDGTSIDTIEEIAKQLGLDAEQIMLPPDHLLLEGAKALPAVVVVRQPNGLTHFVVVWSRQGRMIQLMDPAIGRRWVTVERFQNELYQHAMAVEAAGWREFAASEEFQAALRERLSRAGVDEAGAARLAGAALGQESWEALAALDAAVRLVWSLVRTGGLQRGREAEQLMGRLVTQPALIPVRYWSVRKTDQSEDGAEQVMMRGAVVVRVRGKRASASVDVLGVELSAALAERPIHPGRELLRLVRDSGAAAPFILTSALLAGAVAVVIEALLLRGLLSAANQRVGVVLAILLFSSLILLLEAPILSGTMRLGRQIENRLRMAFLEKIPKLGDRYFQSRLTSDMAERSHASHRLRRLPDLARQLLRAIFELLATAAAIIWILPAAAPWVLLAGAAALVIPFLSHPVLAERDARVRSHAAGLTRFYLDAMLGLLAIRAHRAERSVRKEHEKLLGEWAEGAARLQRAVVVSEAVQLAATFGLIICLLLTHSFAGAGVGRLLLVVYWALNLPSLGQEIGSLARQYPYSRNLTVRLLDPLGAPEEAVASVSGLPPEPFIEPPQLHFQDVSVEASGHVILADVNLEIEPGSHVAIVGPSGAGKSSLVGILLGWLKPSRGQVMVNGAEPNIDQLRRSTAWVDPAVQIWNQSLRANLSYGSDADAAQTAEVIDTASLERVLASLPQGFETSLGEGGGLVSGGEGQRVRFGRALLRRDCRLVILDEPFRGLDREKRRELLARAREYWRDCTLLCVTHDVAETQGFDRVLVIEGGKVIEDATPEELAAAAESRYSQLLSAEAEMHSELWGSDVWRRVEIQGGRVVEMATAESELA